MGRIPDKSIVVFRLLGATNVMIFFDVLKFSRLIQIY